LFDVRPHAGHSCGTPSYVIVRSPDHTCAQPVPHQTSYRVDARYSTRARRERWRTAGKTKTKPPGTSGSLAFPCERADHLEVSCSERYPRPGPPSNGSGKFTFHRMWTSLWKRCAPIVDVLWTEVGIGSQSGGRYVETCSTVVSSNLSGYICRLSSADSVFTAYAPCSVSATYVPAGFGRFARVAAYPDR
jgi:hypothetical protein